MVSSIIELMDIFNIFIFLKNIMCLVNEDPIKIIALAGIYGKLWMY